MPAPHTVRRWFLALVALLVAAPLPAAAAVTFVDVSVASGLNFTGSYGSTFAGLSFPLDMLQRKTLVDLGAEAQEARKKTAASRPRRRR